METDGWRSAKRQKVSTQGTPNGKVLSLPKPVGPVLPVGLVSPAGPAAPAVASAQGPSRPPQVAKAAPRTLATPLTPGLVSGPPVAALVAATTAAATAVAAPGRVLAAAGGGRPEMEETFGYTHLVARAQLCQYCKKRGQPSDISTTRQGNGPVTAWMELRLPRFRGGGVLRQEYTCTGKKSEATNMVALKMCAELCRLGEMPPFRTKAEVRAEGLRACPIQLPFAAVGQLQEFARHMTAYLSGLGVSPRLVRGSLLLDFDAAPWATQPEANEITWCPPRWGLNPWGNEQQPMDEQMCAEETSANLLLVSWQEERIASPGYAPTKAQRESLPIASMKDRIVQAVEASPVVLISGSTGCGKTTQVPQFLLEKAIRRGEATELNIVCTQPRRIAAMAAAERVAEERGEPLGQSVGFIVRFHQSPPRSYGSICFMTTGMLLRRLASKGLRGVSHVIIDEVHERDLDTDFLITVVRILLCQSPGMRVLLMSATIDLAKWAGYFGSLLLAEPIEIPGRLFPVTTYYLDEVHRVTGHSVDVNQQRLESEVPLELVEKLLAKLVMHSAAAERGAILVFLPGWDLITRLQSRLRRQQSLLAHMQVHTLHSQVPREEQRAAFLPAPHPLVKVILSTNIAETSVTISDVVYVIDSCRVKQLVASQSGGGRTVYRLMNTLASKQNLVQRAGRAGRVREGVCYRLCTEATYQRLPESLTPEMVRLPLHQVALMLKSLNLGEAASFLAMSPDPPPPSSVQHAVSMLQDLKALDSLERITTLGSQLAKLPIEPRMGFALLAACMLGLGEPMAALCALSAAPSPYVNEHFRAREVTKSTASSQALLSDHHDLLTVYYEFRRCPPDQAKHYCMRRGLEHRVLDMVAEATDQTLKNLRSAGFSEHFAMSPCSGCVFALGTPREEPQHRQCWAALTFLLGLGLEHFALRQEDRRVWISQHKSSQVKASAAIPEAPGVVPELPFFVFGELQETDWSSSCRSATAAGAVATLLGAARELRYDPDRACALLDGWAPVQVEQDVASLLGQLKSSLRVCLLQLSHRPSLLESDSLILAFGGLVASLCETSKC